MVHPILERPGPTRSFFSILEEDVVNVKDSVTFGLLTHGPIEGMEAGGLGGQLAIPKFKFAKGYASEDVGAEKVGKTAFMPFIVEKGKLLMGRMVESGWESKDYLALARGTISLVGKSTGMLGAASRVSYPRLLGLAK